MIASLCAAHAAMQPHEALQVWVNGKEVTVQYVGVPIRKQILHDQYHDESSGVHGIKHKRQPILGMLG